ncbi:FadR family transcriptional regulator [Cobetia marina]|uniref:FadR/GntR family transcriptional regulator n=1 Tax=Cobetia marina TaxID=28258 RepID=UPI0010AE2A14|nr:FCD domain-containing protein [Cobetia marina]TKD63014.1 FadR family transcriptional regulator [Cobetia marina]
MPTPPRSAAGGHPRAGTSSPTSSPTSATASESSTTARVDVAEWLAQAIFENRYPPGSLIPRELDLCDQHAQSRATVRTAIQSLVNAGILTRTTGQGTRVNPLSEWHLLDPRVTGWMTRYAMPHPQLARDIYAFRISIEPFVAALAATEATAQDLSAIEQAYDGMAAAVHGGSAMEEFDRADIAFHDAIFAATHNVIWAQLGHVLKPSISLLVATSNHNASELGDSLGRHRAVMEAIRLRQPEAAHAATLHVLDRTGRDLGLAMPEVTDGPHGVGRAQEPLELLRRFGQLPSLSAPLSRE